MKKTKKARKRAYVGIVYRYGEDDYVNQTILIKKVYSNNVDTKDICIYF